MHLFWCVAFGAVVHAIKHWRAGLLRPAGIGFKKLTREIDGLLAEQPPKGK